MYSLAVIVMDNYYFTSTAITIDELVEKVLGSTNNKIVYIAYKTKPENLINFLKDQELI